MRLARDTRASSPGNRAADFVEEAPVDFVDDFELPRQEAFEPLHRPLLERLGQQRVVGVSERSLRETPGFVPAQFGLIQQQPHQFRHRHRGMGVVELDRRFVRKRRPIIAGRAETADEIGQRACYEKILLKKTQAFSGDGRVVGIQYPGDGFGGEGFGQCPNEISSAELGKIEVVGRASRPKPKGVDGLPAIADHRPVVRDPNESRRTSLYDAQRPFADLERTVELDLNGFIESDDLPRIGPSKPVVRLLVLPAVANGLAEDAVLVAQSVTHAGQGVRRHRIEKTGSQPPKPAIAQSGVRFLFDDFQWVELVQLLKMLQDRLEPEIGNIIREGSPHQVFH